MESRLSCWGRNGDGLADVAIGGYSSNMFCVIYGSQNPADVTVDEEYSKCLKGDDVESGINRFGSPVTGGDIDGDGVSDIVVGATKPNKTFIFFGKKDLGTLLLSLD